MESAKSKAEGLQTPKITIQLCDDTPSFDTESHIKTEDSHCLEKRKTHIIERRRGSDCTRFQPIRSDKAKDIPRFLKDKVLNANEISHDNAPVMHEAAFEGRIECVKALLKCGAKVNTVDCEHCSALHAAVLGGNVDLVSLLIHYGADLFAETNEKLIPFHIAVEKGDEAMIAILVENMARVSTFK